MERRFRVYFSWVTTVDLGVVKARDEFEAEQIAAGRLSVATSLEEASSDGDFEITEISPEEER